MRPTLNSKDGYEYLNKITEQQEKEKKNKNRFKSFMDFQYTGLPFLLSVTNSLYDMPPR